VIGCGALAIYKSTRLQNYLIHEIPHIAFTLPVFIFISLRLWIQFLENGIKKREIERSAIGQKIRDTEKLLVEQMDPILLTQLKTIVRREI